MLFALHLFCILQEACSLGLGHLLGAMASRLALAVARGLARLQGEGFAPLRWHVHVMCSVRWTLWGFRQGFSDCPPALLSGAPLAAGT